MTLHLLVELVPLEAFIRKSYVHSKIRCWNIWNQSCHNWELLNFSSEQSSKQEDICISKSESIYIKFRKKFLTNNRTDSQTLNIYIIRSQNGSTSMLTRKTSFLLCVASIIFLLCQKFQKLICNGINCIVVLILEGVDRFGPSSMLSTR